MHIHEIRAKSQFEEIDYLFLKEALKNYAEPRQKIRTLLRSKGLVRVKKGLYIFGTPIVRGPYCKEHLANLIYGPSAISLEYALSFYGWIPERLEELTSITIGRNKRFDTPIGRFSYRHMRPDRYPLGITQMNIAGRMVLLATPEKALVDLLVLSKYVFKRAQEFEEHLFQNLRIDEEAFTSSLSTLRELAALYRHPSLKWLLKYNRNPNA